MASKQYGATTTVECLTGSACAALAMWGIARGVDTNYTGNGLAQLGHERGGST
jgi:hypothetical protein